MEDFKSWLAMWIIAVVLRFSANLIVVPCQIIYRSFSKEYDLWYYLKVNALAEDDAGGASLFGSRRKTVSAMTGYMSYDLNRSFSIRKMNKVLAKLLHKLNLVLMRNIIDWLFGKGHCLQEYKDEFLYEHHTIKD